MQRNQNFEPDADARLMDQVKEVLRYHHYAYRAGALDMNKKGIGVARGFTPY